MAGRERSAYIILVGDLRNSNMEDGVMGGGHDTKCYGSRRGDTWSR